VPKELSVRFLPLFVALCVWLAATATPAVAALVNILDVSYDASRDLIVIRADGRLVPKTTRLSNPDRMVIDLPGSRFGKAYQQIDSLAGTTITRVRVGQYLAGTTRVVLDLSRAASFEVLVAGNDVLIPTQGQQVAGAGGAPAPKPPQSQPPAAPVTPILRSINVHQGNIAIAMSSRRPYWSHLERGNPTTYTVVFPNVRLASGLHGAARAVNSGGILRWRSRQEGDDARIEFDLTRTPDFDIAATGIGWHFNQQQPQAARPAQPALPPATDAPLTLRKVGDQWQLVITADRAFTYKTATVADDRIQLDITGARVALPRDSVYIDSGLIARVRVSNLPGGVSRLVIDLDQPVKYGARLLGSRKSVLMSLSRVNKDSVTVDPGHGGTDHGAIGTKGTREKDVTLAIATRLSRIMATNGMSVQMTRMKDLEILLRPRVEMANRNDSDVFISIHANSFGSMRGVQGIETYYFTDESYALAKSVHKHLVRSLKRPDRGVRKNNFYVVHHTKMPAALIEIGYLSNPDEEAKLKDPAYQEQAAQAIYSGIREFLEERKRKKA
jgi:N-acetylmuramoyl-L-alanine amidase CwlD